LEKPIYFSGWMNNPETLLGDSSQGGLVLLKSNHQQNTPIFQSKCQLKKK